MREENFSFYVFYGVCFVKFAVGKGELGREWLRLKGLKTADCLNTNGTYLAMFPKYRFKQWLFSVVALSTDKRNNN